MTSRCVRARAAMRGAIVLAACLAACNTSPQPEDRTPTQDLIAPPTASSRCAPASPATVVVPGRQTLADIAQHVMPSVVSVLSESPAKPGHAGDQDEDETGREALPFARPRRGEKHRVQFSLGSGVILSSAGVILTNNHVVENARQIRVALRDGRVFPATVVGSDAASDIAVLHIAAKDLPVIQVADSSKLRIGDFVLAVGNPFGVGETVTMGIVSGLGRANLGITKYDDFIQTDAAINPGNSGGALVDMNGRLVGINTAILSRTGGYEGIGFAIPSTTAIKIANELIAHGRVTRGWLGVALQDLDDGVARALHVPPDSGALVSQVIDGSPAARAGIARGDIITGIDTTPVTSAAVARNAIALDAPGRTIALRVLRAGQTRQVQVKLGEPPRVAAEPPRAPAESHAGLLGGGTVQPRDAAQRRKFAVPSDVNGVVVTSIAPDSVAAATELEPGDVIVQIDHAPTPTVHAFEREAAGVNDQVLLLIFRKGQTLFLAIVR